MTSPCGDPEPPLTGAAGRWQRLTWALSANGVPATVDTWKTPEGTTRRIVLPRSAAGVVVTVTDVYRHETWQGYTVYSEDPDGITVGVRHALRTRSGAVAAVLHLLEGYR